MTSEAEPTTGKHIFDRVVFRSVLLSVLLDEVHGNVGQSDVGALC